MSATEQEIDRLKRCKAFATVKRNAAVSNIRAVHSLALRVVKEPDLAPHFLVAVTDLDTLWTQFKLEDDTVLDSLVRLGESDDYIIGLPSEVRGLIKESKAIAQRVTPKGAELIDMSFINPLSHENLAVSQPAVPNGLPSSFSRLPEIPLPTFDGDYRYWPTFRDRFKALVECKSNLTTTDKMYYLIGCLHGKAADAVCSIPISSDNYDLAWSTLWQRFNRPRIVATTLVDKLLDFPSYIQESLSELSNFMSVFSECVSLLDALNIPDLGSFILFALAF
ncbi:hypothetical protein AGLY_010305 [Aphis glycines]|uniref:Uncharacterized protein n=1 Tax=Aphis glycines TaxID=307491 RepID=A0A6G0TFP0_APHGL|nr:hypothetical protein AGLY_010305 [Aphis glycines]